MKERSRPPMHVIIGVIGPREEATEPTGPLARAFGLRHFHARDELLQDS